MGMSKRELITEISKTTEFKKPYVEAVLNTFGDIMIREVILNGEFHFTNCFTVKTHKRKARKAYNVFTKEWQLQPETEYLTITLSRKINNWFRWKQRNARNKELGCTPENWEEIYAENNPDLFDELMEIE